MKLSLIILFPLQVTKNSVEGTSNQLINENRMFIEVIICTTLGPVVRRSISANPQLNFYPDLFFFSSKVFYPAIFSILVRVDNQVVGKKEFN